MPAVSGNLATLCCTISEDLAAFASPVEVAYWDVLPEKPKFYVLRRSATRSDRLSIAEPRVYACRLTPGFSVGYVPFRQKRLPATREFELFLQTSVQQIPIPPFPRITVTGKVYIRQARSKLRSQPSGTHFRTADGGWRSSTDWPAPGRQTSVFDFDLLLPVLMPPIDLDQLGVLELPSDLYPFQIEGIRKLVENEAFLLADEMGTGKTVMTSVALEFLFRKRKVRRALVVCPASILAVWESHLADWAASLLVKVVHGSPEERKVVWTCQAHVYVVSYDTFRNDVNRKILPQEYSRFDAIVMDEAHALKNPYAKRTKAVRKVASKTKYRWALTGTPLQNSVDELRSIFEILRPGLLPQELDFVSTEEIKRTIKPFFLRRRKEDVLRDLPPKIHEEYWLELDPDQRRQHDELWQIKRKQFRSGAVEFTRQHVFAAITELKQICNFARGKDKSPKTEALLQQVRQIIANNKKVVVFTQFLEFGVCKLEPLLTSYGVVTLTGKMSPSQRRQAVCIFQEDRRRHVFLGSVKAAGEGITLTAASYVIHFDHWWNPATMWQAEDRVHRVGQSDPVNIYSYWMKDSIEERIYRILEAKGILFDEVIDSLSQTDIDEALSIDDLLQLFDLRRDEVRIPESELRRESMPTVITMRQRLATLPQVKFEQLLTELFEQALGCIDIRFRRHEQGYYDVEGVRRNTAGTERLAARCWRSGRVGARQAREFFETYTHGRQPDKKILLTTDTFTSTCKELCRRDGRAELIDGFKLAELALQNGIEIG